MSKSKFLFPLFCVIFLVATTEVVAQNSQKNPPSLVPLIGEHLPSSSVSAQKAVPQEKGNMRLTVYKDVILTRGRKAPISVLVRKTVVEPDENGKPVKKNKFYMMLGTAFLRGRGDVSIVLDTITDSDGRNRYLSAGKAISASVPGEFIEDNRILSGTIIPLTEEIVHKTNLNTQGVESGEGDADSRSRETQEEPRRSSGSRRNPSSSVSGGGSSGGASSVIPPISIPSLTPPTGEKSDSAPSVVSTSGDGCEPVLDHELGIVKTTSRTVRDGVPDGICKPDGNFYPIKTSTTGCSIVVNIAASSVVPEERKYWVGPNGVTHYLNACLPSESLSYELAEDLDSCTHRPALDGQTISAFVKLVYTDKDGKHLVAEECKPHGAPIPVQISGEACVDFVNLLANIAHPQVERFAMIGGKKEVVSSCAPVLTQTWQIVESPEGCDYENVRISPTEIQQATKIYYEKGTGDIVEVIPCTPKSQTHTVVRDYDVCLDSAPPVFDLDGSARAYYRQHYNDARGIKRWVSQNCLHGVDVIPADRVGQEAGNCEKDILGGEIVFRKRYRYVNSDGVAKFARNCVLSDERYEIHEARVQCDEEVNSERTLAYKRHRRFYYKDSRRIFVDPECRRALDEEGREVTWSVVEMTVGCAVEEIIVARKAYIQSQLVYYDDLGNRHVAQDCARSTEEAVIDMEIDLEGCQGLEHNWVDGSSRPYYRLVYDYPTDFQRVALSCRSPDEDVPAATVFRHSIEQCSDFTIGGETLPAFRVVLLNRGGEEEVLRDCEPDLSLLSIDASLDDDKIYRTFAGCEDIEMEHHFDSADPLAGFSFIPIRKYIVQNAEGLQQARALFLTECEIDRSRAYPHRPVVNERDAWGWQANDAERTSSPQYHLAIDLIEDDRHNRRMVDDCQYNKIRDRRVENPYRENSIVCTETRVTEERILNPHRSSYVAYEVVPPPVGGHKEALFENAEYDNTPNDADSNPLFSRGLKYPHACQVEYPLYHASVWSRPGGTQYVLTTNKDGSNTKIYWACGSNLPTWISTVRTSPNFSIQVDGDSGISYNSYTSYPFVRADGEKIYKEFAEIANFVQCSGNVQSAVLDAPREERYGGICINLGVVRTRVLTGYSQRCVSNCNERGSDRIYKDFPRYGDGPDNHRYSYFPTLAQAPVPLAVEPSSDGWRTFKNIWGIDIDTRIPANRPAPSSEPDSFRGLPLSPFVPPLLSP